MKNFEIKKEIWIWVIMLLPILYLAYIWKTLPDIVPTHFGMDGQPNDWSHKTLLLYVVPGMTVGVYLLLTIIPMIDPKQKIREMGNKYYLLKLFITLFISVLCVFMVQSAITKNIGNSNVVFLLVGALFVFLGNYMQALKPNYFIGIRTPWTLESEMVWRKTHQLGGKLFFVAGMLVMILPFLLKEKFEPVFITVIAVASIIPVAYSFILFKQEKKLNE